MMLQFLQLTLPVLVFLFNDVWSNLSASIRLRWCPFEIGLVSIPISNFWFARLVRFTWKLLFEMNNRTLRIYQNLSRKCLIYYLIMRRYEIITLYYNLRDTTIHVKFLWIYCFILPDIFQSQDHYEGHINYTTM